MGRTLNIVNDFTCKCLTIKEETALPGLRVARVLNLVTLEHGPLLDDIVVDDCSEFRGSNEQWPQSAHKGFVLRRLQAGCGRPGISYSI